MNAKIGLREGLLHTRFGSVDLQRRFVVCTNVLHSVPKCSHCTTKVLALWNEKSKCQRACLKLKRQLTSMSTRFLASDFGGSQIGSTSNIPISPGVMLITVYWLEMPLTPKWTAFTNQVLSQGYGIKKVNGAGSKEGRSLLRKYNRW